jgi:3-hydroxyisobutyrate dehydrogenase
VILMSPDSKVVGHRLWAAEPGQVDRLGPVSPNPDWPISCHPGQIVLDMGSSDPVCSRENFTSPAGNLAWALWMRLCPGGVKRAVDGSLAIMMGGEVAVVERT